MKKALIPLTLYAQDYSDWNTYTYFKTATVESVKRYLKAGADPKAANNEGKTVWDFIQDNSIVIKLGRRKMWK